MTKFKKGDLIECDSSLGRIGWGEKFIVVDSRPQLSAPSFHPELVYIEVDGVVRNYSPKHFKLVEQEETMSRTEIKDKGSGSKTFKEGYWYKCIEDRDGDVRFDKYYKLNRFTKDENCGMFEGDNGECFLNYLRFYVNSESIYNPIVEVLVTRSTETFYTAYVTFPNSYSSKEYAYKINYEQYKLIVDKDNVILNVDVGGTIKKVNLVRLSNHLDPKATKEIYGIFSIDGVEQARKGTPSHILDAVNYVVEIQVEGHVVPKTINATINLNQQEEINMSNAITTRKIVNVTLIDNDPALDVQHSVVAQFDNLVTEDTNDVLIQEILMNPDFDVAGKIQEHNDVRANEVDLAVLKSTGNQVSLQPVKLKQLTWLVK